MKNAIARFKTSTFELKNVKCLAITALLVSASIVFGMYSFMPAEGIRLSLAYLPVAAMGFFFGPVVAVCGAGAIDLINFMLKPMGGFNPGITLCALITGLIYGIFFYQKKLTLPRVSLAFFTNALLSNLLFKSYFLALFYGTTWSAMMITRAPIQVLMLVFETALFMAAAPLFKLIKSKFLS